MNGRRLLRARVGNKVFQGSYEEYLRSPWWRLHVRRQALHRANRRCQECGSPDDLDVHHRTYARLGHEEPDDVVVFCHPCHAKAHGHAVPPYSAARPGGAWIGDVIRRLIDSVDKSGAA